MAAKKNSFTYSIMITVPLTIAMDIMPDNSPVLELRAAGGGDLRRTRDLSMSAVDNARECGNGCSFTESVGWNRVMPKLRAKFEPYEKGDQEDGAVRSFIRHTAKRQEEDSARLRSSTTPSLRRRTDIKRFLFAN